MKRHNKAYLMASSSRLPSLQAVATMLRTCWVIPVRLSCKSEGPDISHVDCFAPNAELLHCITAQVSCALRMNRMLSSSPRALTGPKPEREREGCAPAVHPGSGGPSSQQARSHLWRRL